MRRTIALLTCLLVCAAATLLAWQSKPPKPEDTVRAFAKALAQDDYPAMARLVLGGKPDFDFAKLRTDDQELKTVYTRYDFTVKSVEITGDKAMVTIDSKSETKGERSGDNGIDKVPLQLINGEWKIIPDDMKGATGYFMERKAYVLANPEKVYAQLQLAYGPTRNVGEVEKKLGLERSRFFDEIFGMTDPTDDYNVPWHGYKSMTMVEHTLVLWPVGKADEVVFDMGLEQANYLTYWKRVNGKPKRIWQYKVTEDAKVPQRGDGTLAIWLRKGKDAVRGRLASELFNKKRPYAAYIEIGAIGMFMCYVIRADGTSDPRYSRYGENAILQDSGQLVEKGFFITDEESMLLAQTKISK